MPLHGYEINHPKDGSFIINIQNAMKKKIVVIGSGIFGVSTAFKLLGSGQRVTLIDHLPISDDLKSSNGESRNLRFSHANDRFYSLSSWKAAKEWKKIEKSSGKKLFYDTGVAWFASDENGWEAHSQKTLSELDIPCERLSPDDAKKLFPSLNTDDLNFVLYEPHGGALAAKKCLKTLLELCLDMNCDHLNGHAKIRDDEIYVNDEPIDFDIAIWAVGPWIEHVFPFIDMVRVTMQEVVFFESPTEWNIERVPAFNDITNAFYGCGSLDGMGVKLGYDIKGKEFDITKDKREFSERSVEKCREYIAHRFPALKQAKVKRIKTCQYTMTPDANWIIAPHPDHPRHWIIGAGSAHGFKHGPSLGEYVTDIILNNGTPDPKFSLAMRKERPGGWRDLYQYE